MTAVSTQTISSGATAKSPGEFEAAIDLVHLARQTMDDPALELELLEMFDRQSERIVAELTRTSQNDAKARADQAHKLRGSALAIGAHRVARAAQALEESCRSRGQDQARLLQGLAQAVAEARAEISRLAH
jgi:HPt (histidine-containing phosphotransfer) domain-containing protein